MRAIPDTSSIIPPLDDPSVKKVIPSVRPTSPEQVTIQSVLRLEVTGVVLSEEAAKDSHGINTAAPLRIALSRAFLKRCSIRSDTVCKCRSSPGKA